MHLVGFITKKFVTMQHGHVNVKYKINVRRSVELRLKGLLALQNYILCLYVLPQGTHARTHRYWEAYYCATEPHPDLSGHFHFLQQLTG